MCVQTFTLPNYGKVRLRLLIDQEYLELLLTQVSQVEDFAEFRLRLDNSLEKSLSAIEVLRTRLLRGLLDTPQIDQAVKDVKELSHSTTQLHDNRDFKTLPNFQRKGESSVWDQTALGGKVDVSTLSCIRVLHLADVPSAFIGRMASSFRNDLFSLPLSRRSFCDGHQRHAEREHRSSHSSEHSTCTLTSFRLVAYSIRNRFTELFFFCATCARCST